MAQQQMRLEQFLQKYTDRNLIVMELGIGAHNELIKAPFMKMTEEHSSWQYITLNMPDQIYIPEAIRSRSTAVHGDIAVSFAAILKQAM